MGEVACVGARGGIESFVLGYWLLVIVEIEGGGARWSSIVCD